MAGGHPEEKHDSSKPDGAVRLVFKLKAADRQSINEALDRMKSYSKDRAVALPPVPANGAATPAPAAAAAPARGK